MTNTTRTRKSRNRRRGRTAKTNKTGTRQPALTAAMLLDESHPLHATFVRWVEQREVGNTGHVVAGGSYGHSTADATKLSTRKARKFLAAHPFYRTSAEKVRAQQEAKAA
jgi:hypothetical protein